MAVDNDPDSRPPCRLLDVVPGGDYGFRFRYGRSGLHPFVAWNGELPGTLPMASATGEAPAGLVAYESDNLPAEYRGELLATSWGDHRIDRFTLSNHGATVWAKMTPLVTGDDDFRPVSIAVAPDGSLFVSDWVDNSYSVHGKGRIWHIHAVANKHSDPIVAPVADDRNTVHSLRREIREYAARRLAVEKEQGRPILRRSPYTTPIRVFAPQRSKHWPTQAMRQPLFRPSRRTIVPKRFAHWQSGACREASSTRISRNSSTRNAAIRRSRRSAAARQRPGDGHYGAHCLDDSDPFLQQARGERSNKCRRSLRRSIRSNYRRRPNGSA